MPVSLVYKCLSVATCVAYEAYVQGVQCTRAYRCMWRGI